MRLFMGPVEGAGSLATPGENLRAHTEKISETVSPQATGNQGRFLAVRDFQESNNTEGFREEVKTQWS